MRLSRLLMRNVWYGSMRNQFTTNGETNAVRRPGNRPPIAVAPTRTSRYREREVATDSSRPVATRAMVSPVIAAGPNAKPAMRRSGVITRSRVTVSVCPVKVAETTGQLREMASSMLSTNMNTVLRRSSVDSLRSRGVRTTSTPSRGSLRTTTAPDEGMVTSS